VVAHLAALNGGGGSADRNGTWSYDCSLGGTIEASYSDTTDRKHGTYVFHSCKEYEEIVDWVIDALDNVAMDTAPQNIAQSSEVDTINGKLDIDWDKSRRTYTLRANAFKIDARENNADNDYVYMGTQLVLRIQEREVEFLSSQIKNVRSDGKIYYDGCLKYVEGDKNGVQSRIHISGTDVNVTMHTDATYERSDNDLVDMDANVTMRGYIFAHAGGEDEEPVRFSAFADDLRLNLSVTDANTSDANATFAMNGDLGDDCLASVTTYDVRLGPKWTSDATPKSGYIKMNGTQARAEFNGSDASVYYNDGAS
jgi:hypothetical protein